MAYNACCWSGAGCCTNAPRRPSKGSLHERLEEHYNELAHHYSRSGNTAKAVDYLHRAGQQAVERSAYAEAVSHLTTALDLLTTLPESRERSQQELVVQMTLGTALRATKGQAAPEVERLYTRARELCEQVGEPPQLFRVLWGLWMVYSARGEYQKQRALGEQLLSLAQRLQDPDLLLEAHHALWTTLLAGGELAAARPHQEQGMRLYDPQRHRTHAALYSGHDPGVCCRQQAAHSLWLLGYPDQAVASIQAALALAQQLAHPYESGPRPVLGCHAASPAPGGAADPGTRRGRYGHCDRPGVSALISAGNAPAGLGASRGVGKGRRGERRSSRAWPPTKRRGEKGPTVLPGPARRGVRPGGADRRGAGGAGRGAGDTAQSGVRWWEAELYRLRGELLLQHTVAQPGEAEACFSRPSMWPAASRPNRWSCVPP